MTISDRQKRSCSWCHELNEIDPVGANFCVACRHRSDVPHSACDCWRCIGARALCGTPGCLQPIDPAEVAMRCHEDTGDICLRCYSKREERQFEMEEASR